MPGVKRSNQEKGHPDAAPLRDRRREVGWIDRASCPDDPLAGVLSATLWAIPPPACSRHRGGRVKGQSKERGSLFL